METVRLEQNGRGYRADGSQLRLWSPAPALLVIQVIGHGQEAFAGPIIEDFDRLTASGARLHLFVDLERMESYDGALRTRCTEHFRVRLQAFDGFHVSVESRFVAMAVMVANVALRGIITMHTARAPFARALDNQLALHGVADFSSGVLAS